MIDDLKQEKEEASLELRDESGNDLFRIGSKGEVFWFKPDGDEMVRAEVDEDLGKAMALAILQISGMDYVKLIEVYLGESVQTFKDLLLKKLMDSNKKAKSIKKVDIVKIMDEFKI